MQPIIINIDDSIGRWLLPHIILSNPSSVSPTIAPIYEFCLEDISGDKNTKFIINIISVILSIDNYFVKI